MPKSDLFRSVGGRRHVEQAYTAVLDSELVGVERRTVATGLGATFVLSAGPADAPRVLLLHGSGSTALSWALELRELADRYRLHAIDLVGEPGRSAPVRPVLGSDAYAVWLTEVAVALDARPAVVVGLSLGGWLALDYAIRLPGQVSALVLISPSGIGRRAVAPLLVAGLMSVAGERGRRIAMALLLGLRPRQAADLLDGPAGQLASLTLQHFRPRVDPIPTFTDEQLVGLSMPVAIMLGERDRMLDAVGSAHRARRLLGEHAVALVPSTGHLLPDQTLRIGAALDTVINQAAGPT